MRRKCSVSVILMLALFAGLLSACGGKTASEKSSSGKKSSEETSFDKEPRATLTADMPVITIEGIEGLTYVLEKDLLNYISERFEEFYLDPADLEETEADEYGYDYLLYQTYFSLSADTDFFHFTPVYASGALLH